MARYRLKRKYYGLVDSAGSAVGNTLGGTMEMTGKALDNKVAGLAGGILGGNTIGAGITSAIQGTGGFLSSWGGPVGWLAGAAIGSAATRGLGKGLKAAGQDLQSY